MTLLHQAAQKAVEALTELADAGAEAWSEDRPCQKQARAAITALQAALQQQPEPVAAEEAAYQRGKRAGYIDGYRAAHADERQQPDISPALQHQEVPREPVAAHHHEAWWLIEYTVSPRPLYYAGPRRDKRPHVVQLVEDASKAVRFPTEDSAKLIIAGMVRADTTNSLWHLQVGTSGYRAAEHIFDYTPRAASPSTTRQQEVGSEPYCTHGYKRGRDFCPYCDVAAAPSTPEKA